MPCEQLALTPPALATPKATPPPAPAVASVLVSFDTWLALRFNTPEQRQGALRLIAAHVAERQRKMEAP